MQSDRTRHPIKIRKLLSSAAELGLTKHDFADLAVIAAKRSGIDKSRHERVVEALGIEPEPSDRGSKLDHLKALGQLCGQLGGRLAIVSQRDISAMIDRDWPDYDNAGSFEEAEAGFDLEHHEGFSSPENSATHGQEWGKKIVYAVRGCESVGQIIHEMGHVFADRYPPDSSKCREWYWFGWEMAVARRIGAWQTWSRHNETYGISRKGADWGDLSVRGRQAVMADRIRYATKIGILSEVGEPRSIR